MIRESLFYKVLSAIHIVLFTSIFCFGIVFLSGSLLMLPAFGAAFCVGKDFISKKLDITDSIIRTYFRYLKSSFKLIRFIPVNIIMILNILGMLVAGNSKNMIYSVVCLVIVSFLMMFVLYIAGYYTFVDEHVKLMEVLISLFIKPALLIPVFIVMVLLVSFFSGILMVILLLTGTFFLFAIEVVILVQMLYYRRLTGMPEDELSYLINHGKKQE